MTHNAIQERRSMTGLALKWVHLGALLIVYFLTIGAIYGALRSQIDENSRRVKDLEDQGIKRDQFNQMREDLIRRLDRIESKVDRMRDLR